LLKNDDNPIYFNFFNDIGIVWDNKTAPTHANESIRSSAGFGIKFYSFVGPIAFTWGFPIEDESYDIKRMFTFSIGNIN
jgi:Outer membrane protein/protective antigen OMA87